MKSNSKTQLRQLVNMVCDTCGSEDVFVDAWASWNTEAQRWELENTFDAGYCNDCGRASVPLAKIAK